MSSVSPQNGDTGLDHLETLLPTYQPTNQEGFSSRVSSSVHSRVRVGIISNQEGDCHSPDSFIGFGGGGSGFKNACGNGASWGPDNGNKNIKAFGYIFVQ